MGVERAARDRTAVSAGVERERIQLVALARELLLRWGQAAAQACTAEALNAVSEITGRLVEECLSLDERGLAVRVRTVDTLLRELVRSGERPDSIEQVRLADAIRRLHDAIVGPEAEPVPVARKAGATGPARDETGDHRPRVYVFGDAPERMAGYTTRLGEHGYKAETFDDLQALHLALSLQLPQAVLLLGDAHDPRAGARLVSELRLAGLHEDLPVVLVAPQTDSRCRLQALAAGADACLVEPLGGARLARRLHALIGNRQPQPHRVLLLDADPVRLERLAGMLRGSGCHVRTLDDPGLLLETAAEEQPDVLVFDAGIPEADAPTLMRLIRDEPALAQLPVLLLAAEEDRLPVLTGGGVEVLPKPTAPGLLVGAVRAHAAGQRRRHGSAIRDFTHRDASSGLATVEAFRKLVETALARNDAGISALLYVAVDNLLQGDMSELRRARWRARFADALDDQLLGSDIAGMNADGAFLVFARRVDLPKLESFARDVAYALGCVTLDELGHGNRPSVYVGVARAESGMLEQSVEAGKAVCVALRREGGDRVRLHPVLAGGPGGEEQRDWMGRISGAIKEGRLFLMYQPITSLAGDHGERYEVLLRMRDTEGRTLLPEQFLGAATRLGLDRLLDHWVVSRALRGLEGRLKEQGDTCFFIKLSGASVADPGFAEWLEAMLAKVSVQPRSCVFEISEATLLVVPRRTEQLLRRVRAAGYGTALEHFAAAEESLALLPNLPLDYVKLDRSLTANLATNPGRQNWMRELVHRIRSTGPRIIAGYVEDAQSLGLLWQAEIELVQGNFVQQPDEWLHHGSMI